MSKVVAFSITIVVAFFIILGLAEQTAVSRSKDTITLTDCNTVSLNMAIDSSTAHDVQQALLDKSQLLNSYDPIYLVLNSPGGSIDDGEKIIETIKGIPQLVHTISIFSASMSFIISQYADKRYILESGQMMSHRAYAEGLSGQVPGNLVTRTLGLLSNLEQVDTYIAKRAGMEKVAYQELIRDELWMRGSKAVDLKFADEVTRVRCAKSLNGPTEPKHYRMMGLDVAVTWHKCPLITSPLSVELSGKATPEQTKKVKELLYDRAEYLKYKATNESK